jgi:HAD superfamily hydrolase (TIGR01509 family)
MERPAFVLVQAIERPAGCLFDLDGLLLDTEPLHGQAWQGAITHFGAELPENFLLELRGRNRFDNARLLIERLSLRATVEELLAIQQPLARAKVIKAKPMPGAEALVARIQGLQIPMALATSSGEAAVTLKTSPHPWLQAIEVRVFGDDPMVRQGKPAPDIFLEAARRLGLAASSCWAFEDSQAGAQAALGAGCQVFVLPAPGLSAKDYPAGIITLESLDSVPL